MNKLISLLARNSLRVNYFTFFVLGALLNVISVYLPDLFNTTVGNLLKFFMIFSIAMYVTDHRKVISISFGCLVAVCVGNILLGCAKHFGDGVQMETVYGIIAMGISLLYLFVLLLLWNYALSRQKSIMVFLFLLELYNSIGLTLLPKVFSVLPDIAFRQEVQFFCMATVPLILLIPLFILIAKNGKKKWVDRLK